MQFKSQKIKKLLTFYFFKEGNSVFCASKLILFIMKKIILLATLLFRMNEYSGARELTQKAVNIFTKSNPYIDLTIWLETIETAGFGDKKKIVYNANAEIIIKI